MKLSRSYTPFGEELASSGSYETPFGFAGEMHDASGLLYLRARYLSTETGRFTSTDSFAGYLNYPASMNPYQYAYNNPLRYVDPSGESVLVALGFVAAGGAIGAGGSIISQYLEYGNLNCIDWGKVGIAALAGAGAMAVGIISGAAIAAVGTMALGEGLVASVLVGVVEGVISGQLTRATSNLILGNDIGEGLFNPKDMLIDGILGGIGGAVGYGLVKLREARAAAKAAKAVKAAEANAMANSIDNIVQPEINWPRKPHRNGTEGHWETIVDEVSNMKQSGKYSKIYVNKGLGNEIAGAKPNNRPDIYGVRNESGIIDQVEVPSKTDNPMDLINRMIDNQKIIGERAGTIKIKVIPPKK